MARSRGSRRSSSWWRRPRRSPPGSCSATPCRRSPGSASRSRPAAWRSPRARRASRPSTRGHESAEGLNQKPIREDGPLGGEDARAPSGPDGTLDQAFALRALARQLAGPAHRLRPLASLALGGLLVGAAQLHLAEDTLPLHLLLERAQRLIDVVVAHHDLDQGSSSFWLGWTCREQRRGFYHSRAAL